MSPSTSMISLASKLELGDLEGTVARALAEDLSSGDVTAQATMSAQLQTKGIIIAKQELVVCGQAVAHEVFAQVGGEIRFEPVVADGTVVSKGATVARIAGAARSVLGGERTALNFMQRLSGTASLTRRFVEAAKGRCRIVDTRKTTPGLRALQRYAVRCGGGHNHRFDLGSGVLIKENHIRAAGGIAAAIAGARRYAPHTLAVECEVTTLDELREAIAAGTDIVMLDNMDDGQTSQAVAIVRGSGTGAVVIEASGDMSVARVEVLAGLGVDIISVGALTHSAPAADLSLLLELARNA